MHAALGKYSMLLTALVKELLIFLAPCICAVDSYLRVSKEQFGYGMEQVCVCVYVCVYVYIFVCI